MESKKKRQIAIAYDFAKTTLIYIKFTIWKSGADPGFYVRGWGALLGEGSEAPGN